MAHALQHVAWEQCLIEPRPDRTLEAYARRRHGMPFPSIRYFAPVPWLARALVDLHPEYGLLLHIRLLRPLLSWMLERHRFRGRPATLERAVSDPYARLVAAYAGSPIAPALARTLEEMRASPHLSRRCKLLMLAVIARGLACEVCAAEVGEALRDEGLREAT